MAGYNNLPVDYVKPLPATQSDQRKVALLCASCASSPADLEYLLQTLGMMPYDYSKPLLPP